MQSGNFTYELNIFNKSSISWYLQEAISSSGFECSWITQPCMGFANKIAPGVSEGFENLKIGFKWFILYGGRDL